MKINYLIYVVDQSLIYEAVNCVHAGYWYVVSVATPEMHGSYAAVIYEIIGIPGDQA